MHTRLALALGLLVCGSAVLIRTMYLPAEPEISQPAAHAVFLAWAREHGYVDLEPCGRQEGCFCWSVEDASANEYLYGIAALERITTVRIWRQGAAWKAERAYFQLSVGKPSWRGLAERDRQAMPPGTQVKVILEQENTVVITLVRPETTPSLDYAALFPECAPDPPVPWDFIRFTKGDDGLWRRFMVYDTLGSPDSTYATPEDVLVAFARKHYPALSIVGDCVQAQAAREVQGVCWTHTGEWGDRRIYMIGLVSGIGEEVEIVQHEPGWVGRPHDRFP